MSEDDPDSQLVRVEHGALARTNLSDNRILSEMVGASLVLAKGSAPAPIDLDALVREGKRLYISKVVGMTEEDIHTFEYSFESAVWCKIATLKREQGGRGMTEENIRAFGCFIRAAQAGHSKAQFLVAELCYWFGAGVPLDYREAVKWYRKAAEQGDVTAQFALAICYQLGEGVPQDHGEAVTWFRKAAEQGGANAQENLGWCYAKGQGVPEDLVEAARWFRQAAEQGHAEAKLKRILIVEDDIELSDVLKELLESVCFSVVTAPDGIEGLRVVLDVDFDIVICNIVMPRLPGDMFYLAVKKVKPHLCERFIFITGNCENARVKSFFAQIKATFLPKPVLSSSLFGAISALVSRNSMRVQSPANTSSHERR